MAVDWKPMAFRSKVSRMLSICRVDEALAVGRQAPDVDAAIVVLDRGSTHSLWCAARSALDSQPPMRLK